MRILPGKSGLGDGHVEEPQARYAHQLVYDPKTGQAFMHGGNGGVGSETPLRKQEGEVEGDSGTRLDDFWSMRLERYRVFVRCLSSADSLDRISLEEIIRRTSFKIRTQQYAQPASLDNASMFLTDRIWSRFREMCEEQPAVVALSFLQNQVSSVVDHGSMDEAAMFRSLLTHLLNPATRSRPITPARGRGHGQSRQHQEGSRKRSRSEDDWTNRLSGESDEDVEMSSGVSEPSNGITTLRLGADPLERNPRPPLVSTPAPPDADLGAEEQHSAFGLASASESDPGPTDQPPPPSSTRFKQRVEVFETLLEFVNENAKEPSGNLLDSISVIEGH